MIYEIAIDAVNEYVSPHTSFLSLFSKLVGILFEYRTEKDLIKLASDDPEKAIRIASLMLALRSIELNGPAHALTEAVKTLEPAVPKMLLTAYIRLACSSTDKSNDLLLKMIRSMLIGTYASYFMQDPVEKCGCLTGEALASCIYSLTEND